MLDALLICLTRVLTGVTARCMDESVFEGPKVYYANHSSHLDLMTIRAAMPGWLRKNTVPIAAKDYWTRGPVRRYLAEVTLGAIFVDRHSHRDLAENLDAMASTLSAGKSLILFPEGTRSTTGEMSPFKGGLYRLATLRPQIPLVPIWLENLNRILPKGEVLPVPFVCSVTFGRSFTLDDNEPKEHFLQRAQRRLEQLRELDE